MTTLHTDFETASEVNLLTVGLEAYAAHPSTRVLMQSWALDDGPVRLWLPGDGKMPSELRDALTDPHVQKLAWNAAFEVAITREVLKIAPTNWRCVMAMAHYASLPGSLDAVGKIVGLAEDDRKMADGKRLIRKFCMPRTPTKGKPWRWNTAETDPEDWALFCGYCVRDTDAERSIFHKLKRFRMPEFEWRLWALDQKINRRGMPVDALLVDNAIAIAAREKPRLAAELRKLTGLPSHTSAHFLPWAREQGYPFNDLRKDTIQRALTSADVTDTLREAFRLRGQISKTSTAKYEAIRESAYQGRVRHAYQFYGASRTGRWTGRRAQLQNLPRPDVTVEKKLELATEMIRAGDYDGIYMEFGNAMTVLSSCVRSAFRAPEGRKLVVADLNAIENRALGWLAGCQRILDVFAEGRCPYIDFATDLYGGTYEQLWAEYKAGDKAKRTGSKPAVLGAGYRLGGGDLRKNKNGDEIKTGLWGYAENMGVRLTREEAHKAVRVFRKKFPEVVQFWKDLEEAAFAAVREKRTTKVGHVVFDHIPGAMRIRLPTGRHLHYLRPAIGSQVIEVVDYQRTAVVDGVPVEPIVYKKRRVEVLTYDGQDQKTKKWSRQTTHGGKLTENLCQAVSRDVIAMGMVRADIAGFDLIGSVHDEIISETDEGSRLTSDLLCELMSKPIGWAPGFPLAAAGYESKFYKKD